MKRLCFERLPGLIEVWKTETASSLASAEHKTGVGREEGEKTTGETERDLEEAIALSLQSLHREERETLELDLSLLRQNPFTDSLCRVIEGEETEGDRERLVSVARSLSLLTETERETDLSSLSVALLFSLCGWEKEASSPSPCLSCCLCRRRLSLSLFRQPSPSLSLSPVAEHRPDCVWVSPQLLPERPDSVFGWALCAEIVQRETEGERDRERREKRRRSLSPPKRESREIQRDRETSPAEVYKRIRSLL